jgi:hypothetical protein
VILAGIHPSYDSFWERWGSVVSNSLVALGVSGEIQFSRMAFRRDKELKRRSDEKVAETTKLAEEAQLERVKLEERLAPRRMTKEQYDKLQALRGVVDAVNITSMSDFEATRFAAQLAKTLRDAGIDAKIHSQRIGLAWTELYVVLPTLADFRADPLYAALKDAGFTVGCGARVQPSLSMGDLPSGIPVIMVGQKAPLPVDGPPYPFTVLPKTDDRGVIIK